MKKKNIYILSEYFKREFYSNILISVIASQKKYNVYVGTNTAYKYLLKKNLLKPGIFHTKSVSHGLDKRKFHKSLFDKNFILTCIDEEHGVINEGSYEDIFIKPRIDQKDLKFFKAFFCWGNYDYKRLSSFFKKKKKIFYLTGSPRVDLWKKKFSEFWKNSKFEKKKHILIVSNFNLANNYYSFQKIVNKIKKEGYYKRSPRLEKIEKDYFIYQNENIKYFLKMVKNLSKEIPNQKIIFRPHPTENPEFWKKKLSNLSNVEICDKEILSELINSANCVVQSGCTSAIESYISNKPIINYLPINKKNQFLGKFITKFSINITSEKKLINFIKKKKYRILQNKKKIVNNRMMFLEKKFSASKIINIWEKLIKKQKQLGTNDHFKMKINLFFSELTTDFLRNLVLFLKGKLHLKKKFFHKFPEIDLKDTEIKISKIKKILNHKNHVKIEKLGKQLIHIS